MKMNVSSALDNLSMNKRIKTIRVLEFLLEHSWAMIIVLLLNLAFTWFFVMMGKLNGFFDIFTLLIFPFVMIIAEGALLLFSVFCEICAEMVADAIFPRYTEFPQALLIRREAPAAPAAEPVQPAQPPKAQTAYQPKNPRYGSPAAASGQTRKEPFKPDLSERLAKLDSILPPENKLWKAIAPAVASYRDALTARGLTVPAGELRHLWLVITRMIAVDNASSFKEADRFITNAVSAIKSEMPEIQENWPLSAIKDEYYKFDSEVLDAKAKLTSDRDDVSKEIIATLGIFLANTDRLEYAEAEAVLEQCVLSAVENASAML